MIERLSQELKKYKPFTDKVVYFWDYKFPDDEMNAPYDAFRFKGFDMLPITNSIVQIGKSFDYRPGCDFSLSELVYKNNMEKYGHACGAMCVPNIVMYNNDMQCYYGLGYESGGINGITYYIVIKYDENGRYISSRRAVVRDYKVIEEKSTCNKKLHGFIIDMIREYESSPAGYIEDLLVENDRLRNKVERLELHSRLIKS